MAYKCARCGRKFDDAYNITKWFNGATSVEIICEECIGRIGKDDDNKSQSSNLSE